MQPLRFRVKLEKVALAGKLLASVTSLVAVVHLPCQLLTVGSPSFKEKTSPYLRRRAYLVTVSLFPRQLLSLDLIWAMSLPIADPE